MERDQSAVDPNFVGTSAIRHAGGKPKLDRGGTDGSTVAA
jgi:hypothetical protein